MSREPRREIRKPATSISAAVEMPWLTMYSVAPDWPWLVIAKMPMMMKPKCEIDAYATSRLMSRWPTASSAP